ncbi:sensor histidine kinase [Candidatus Nitrosotenuis chungbukensis]|uniref:sensor histidine kinase n=1 Tax=Candidatus Nitrosotenuis chungbukensis TaxID=1353246 RepID=UPI000694EB73|nr:ATP-binding protein [Candidatus Nitrosotenuis chungbukensis]
MSGTLSIEGGISYDALLDKIKALETEKQKLKQENMSQSKIIVDLERKMAKLDEVTQQRDWLLDTLTKKISDLSRFQTDLFRAERFSTIGEMSARLAHDMRNPLAIIKNTIEVVKLKHSSKIPNDLMSMFSAIDKASSRMVFQLDEVLNFVRTSPLECDEYSLSEILDSSIDKIVVPDRIQINRPENDVRLFCDMKKIEAVFTNLLMNAIQAMENSGQITIRFFQNNDVVTFEVEDSGPGIPENLLDKIFEPLFTTKSCGTGLGLPTVKAIIQQHCGTIEVKNAPTVFSIFIPKTL